jgi:hypothetical protein
MQQRFFFSSIITSSNNNGWLSIKRTISNTSSSNSKTPNSIVIVHRHGDRTPGLNFFATHNNNSNNKPTTTINELQQQEENFWFNQIYYNTTDNNKNSTKKTNAFGQLTNLGYEQLFFVGKNLSQIASDTIQKSCDIFPIVTSDVGPGNTIITTTTTTTSNRVYARSTDYERTITSARALLFGMIQQSLEIQRKPRILDNFNPWDSSPRLREVTKRISQENKFIERENIAKEAKEALLTFLPIYNHNPTFFRWVWAADYFVTRHNHHAGNNNNNNTNDLIVIPELDKYRTSTLDMATFEFARYYSDPYVQTCITGPLLFGILNHFLTMSSITEQDLKKKWMKFFPLVGLQMLEDAVEFRTNPIIAVFSGHDVTILPLLCFFNFVGDPYDLHQARYERIWPTYASRIIFELYLETENNPGQNKILVKYQNGVGKQNVVDDDDDMNVASSSSSPQVILFDGTLDEFEFLMYEKFRNFIKLGIEYGV